MIVMLLLLWPRFSQDALRDLEGWLEEAVRGGLDVAEVEEFERRWTALEPGLEGAGEVASAAKLAARVCEEGPVSATAALRSAALRSLVTRAGASRRARLLVQESFWPRLDRLPPGEQVAEMTRFDAALAELGRLVPGTAMEADLAFSALRLRREVHRSWPAGWFESQRPATLQAAQELRRTHGTLSTPRGESYAQELDGLERDLRDLPFGADLSAWGGVDLEGKAMSLSDFRGQVVVVTFWSSWCQPCLAMVPDEVELLRRLADRPFALVGVCADPSREQALATARRVGMTWPSFFDPGQGPDESLAARACIESWPSSYVLDAGGRIRAKFLPTIFRTSYTTAEIEAVVRSLLDAAPPSEH